MAERRGGLPVFALVGSAFCVVLTFLALQMRAGQDPAIGAGARPAEPRPVVVRRVIVRRLVEPAAPAGAGARRLGARARRLGAGARARRTGPAPAPAPAPAPVTTQAS